MFRGYLFTPLHQVLLPNGILRSVPTYTNKRVIVLGQAFQKCSRGKMALRCSGLAQPRTGTLTRYSTVARKVISVCLS
jgi:hypothetical protein